MNLKDLGYSEFFEKFRNERGYNSFGVGRVVSEHKERYGVRTENDEFDAEIVGNLRFSALSRDDFPAVGDWVAISEYDENKALIHAVFPRKSIIERQAVGKFGEKQIIATNIDYAFIVQAVDRDFNINRIQRYLTICNASKVEPVLILSKIDLIEKNRLKEILENVRSRIDKLRIVSVSNQTKDGYEELNNLIEKRKTYCLLGSSGVGKSSLLNNLSGKEQMKTASISVSSNKGRHITSHRELVILDKGGILIDNPGMREVGITENPEGIEMTFDEIYKLSANCKFKDCKHTQENDCAVLEAVENGEVDLASYENFLKMEKEKVHFESSVAEKRKKDKEFGKMIKVFKKTKNMTKN